MEDFGQILPQKHLTHAFFSLSAPRVHHYHLNQSDIRYNSRGGMRPGQGRKLPDHSPLLPPFRASLRLFWCRNVHRKEEPMKNVRIIAAISAISVNGSRIINVNGSQIINRGAREVISSGGIIINHEEGRNNLSWSRRNYNGNQESEGRGVRAFLRERAELRLSPFTAEEEERMANPRPKSEAERILTICSRGEMGLREAIAETRRVYSC